MVERFKYFGMEDKVTSWIASTEPKENFVYYLNNGQRCCAQSHINVWRHIVEKNLEYALILEDDACFDKKWLEKLDLFCNTNQDKEWTEKNPNKREDLKKICPHCNGKFGPSNYARWHGAQCQSKF